MDRNDAGRVEATQLQHVGEIHSVGSFWSLKTKVLLMIEQLGQ